MSASKGWTVGPSVRRVRIEAVDYNQQIVEVSMPSIGTMITLPLAVRRSRLDIPKVGETWIIERALGPQWVLAALVSPATPRPTVTGSRAAADAVGLSLLAALVDLGLVVDETSP